MLGIGPEHGKEAMSELERISWRPPEEAEEAPAELTLEERALKPGGIWRTSWGYDQTNVEFFQVVRETKASIVLRRIGATVRDGRLFPLGGQWATDFGLMGNSAPYGDGSQERDQKRGYSEKMCRKPRVTRDGYQCSSVKITDSRYAYPYEGGGAYETFASGGAGH